VALEEIAKRFPDEVIEDELMRTYQAHVRGFAKVPLSIQGIGITACVLAPSQRMSIERNPAAGRFQAVPGDPRAA
jgi:hypothetical protein